MPADLKEPTKEELAAYIKAIWGALIKPSWTYDELVTLGKMVYAKVPLAKIDGDVMQVLLPKLAAVSREVYASLHVAQHTPEEIAAPPPPEEPKS